MISRISPDGEVFGGDLIGNGSYTVGDLEQILSDDLKTASIWSGHEIVLPYEQAIKAILTASEHQIAILGLEAFEAREEGLLTIDLADASSYIRFTGDWKAYVTAMNAEAEHWLKRHRLGENHGYILTSASQREFASLQRRTR